MSYYGLCNWFSVQFSQIKFASYYYWRYSSSFSWMIVWRPVIPLGERRPCLFDLLVFQLLVRCRHHLSIDFGKAIYNFLQKSHFRQHCLPSPSFTCCCHTLANWNRFRQLPHWWPFISAHVYLNLTFEFIGCHRYSATWTNWRKGLE